MYLYVIVGKSHKASWSLRCLPPRPTTQADNLCGQRQLPLIARQGSVEAGLWSNGSATGTPSKPRKNLIRTAPRCLLLCPSPIARKTPSGLQRLEQWCRHERAFSQVGETGKVTETREDVGNNGGATPRTLLLPPLGLSNRRRLRSLTLTLKAAQHWSGGGSGALQKVRGDYPHLCHIHRSYTMSNIFTYV